MTDGPIAPGCLESVVWPCSVLDWSSHHTDLPSSRASGKPCPPWAWTQRMTWKGQCYAGLVLRLILSPVFSWGGGQGASYYLANAHSGRRQAAATTPQQLFPTSHCPAPPPAPGDLQIPETDEPNYIQAAQEMPLVPVVSDFQDQNCKSNLSRHSHASVYTGEQPQPTSLLLGGLQDHVCL